MVLRMERQHAVGTGEWWTKGKFATGEARGFKYGFGTIGPKDSRRPKIRESQFMVSGRGCGRASSVRK
jgi:hypothetical protein